MKKNIWIFLSYVLVAALASFATWGMVTWLGFSTSKLNQLADVITYFHIDDVDPVAMEDAAAEAMVDALDDRWSYYIPASEYSSYVEHSNNVYLGIGISASVDPQGAGLKVENVYPGGGAEDAGIQLYDVIVQINGVSTAGMTIGQFKELLQGEAGTQVELVVHRGMEEIPMSVTLKHIPVQVAYGQILEGNVGYIVIENFEARCASETITAIESLMAEGAEKLIFDLRFNIGGYAEELVELLDYLLPEGDLFRSVNFMGVESVDKSDSRCLDIPMVVLVNSGTYSAAEFFAAALQEYGVATVVGEKTVGKGYYQNTILLKDGSAVALSTGKYFTPNGVSLEGVGITPDVPVSVDDETLVYIYYHQLPAEEDPQLQAALEVLK